MVIIMCVDSYQNLWLYIFVTLKGFKEILNSWKDIEIFPCLKVFSCLVS